VFCLKRICYEKELVIEFNDHSQDVDLDEVYQKIVK